MKIIALIALIFVAPFSSAYALTCPPCCGSATDTYAPNLKNDNTLPVLNAGEKEYTGFLSDTQKLVNPTFRPLNAKKAVKSFDPPKEGFKSARKIAK